MYGSEEFLYLDVAKGVLEVDAAGAVWRVLRGPLPEGLTINHINGVKDDNRPDNLELATHFEQREHARVWLTGSPFKLSPGDVATRIQADGLGT
jgi:hypothetical protein